MALANTVDILKDAKARKFGVPAYDVNCYEAMRWVVTAAEEVRSPVILMYYPDFGDFISLSTFAAMARDIAEHASVPVSIHLDHSKSIDEIKEAIRCGFTSVMFDGSALPFEENVALTKEVVDYAHPLGIGVEAELGVVGKGSNREDFKDTSLYTNPAQAKEFVERTGVDLLAVAIGNSHGVYVEVPHLDIPRLDELTKAVSIPLVLHGTSQIPDEQLVNAVLHGITKTNIATEFYILMRRTIKEQAAALTEEQITKMDLCHYADVHIKPVALDYFTKKMNLLNPNHVQI